jgi:hypothetical protein
MNWLLGGADGGATNAGTVQMPTVPETRAAAPAGMTLAELPASELYRKLQLESMECQVRS